MSFTPGAPPKPRTRGAAKKAKGKVVELKSAGLMMGPSAKRSRPGEGFYSEDPWEQREQWKRFFVFCLHIMILSHLL